MAKLGKFQYTKVDLQDNMYFLQVKKIKEKKWDDDNTSLNWSFLIAQPPHVGKNVYVWGTTSNVPTPKNRLTQFGMALGYTLDQLRSDDFNTDLVEGSFVKGLLETKLSEDGTPKLSEEGSPQQHVTKLFALSESEVQQLQIWLQQAQVTGSAKVAVQATPTVTVPLTPTKVNLAPSAVPVQTGLAGNPSLPTQPIGTASPLQVEPVRRRPNSMPF